MDPKDLNLYLETATGGPQADAPTSNDSAGDPATALQDAANALSGAARVIARSRVPGAAAPGTSASPPVTKSLSSLSYQSKERIHASLKQVLERELAASGSTMGLRPGDLVAISSSIGQSISF